MLTLGMAMCVCVMCAMRVVCVYEVERKNDAYIRHGKHGHTDISQMCSTTLHGKPGHTNIANAQHRIFRIPRILVPVPCVKGHCDGRFV